ncbi:MAG: hypothetical protein JNK72_04260 [Myxococcales bacterium]|nr:hypothetical protein [Myxococcales bacterium]
MKSLGLRVVAGWMVTAMLSGGCSDSAPSAPAGDASVDAAADLGASDVPTASTDAGSLPSLPEGDCDPLDPTACAFPWPSNLYLRRDAARPTGYTLRFGPRSLPANRSQVNINPLPFERLDGYGLGAPIMVRFPNLDLTGWADEEHPERSLAADASALLFEVDGQTVTRVPYFVELDAQESDPSRKTLFLRPLVILKENRRYLVAFRNLRTTAGAAIEPSAAFARLRGAMTAGDTALAPRQARFDEVFALLEAQGVSRASLTLAWDFNTASSQALHGTLLRMRDEVLARYPMGPTLTITGRQEFAATADGTGRDVNANIALQLDGTIEVPNYMRQRTFGTTPVWLMNTDAAGLPTPNGTRTVEFSVRIPHSAVNGEPHGLVQYGHGLLGGYGEVEAGYNGRIANNNRLIFFASNLTGMATEDVPVVLQTLREGSAFQGVGDRLHQGMIEWVLLARAMKTQFAGLPDVRARNIRVNPDELFYSGISQGGIFGGTYVAIAPDITRGHLGVPGNNYVTLLHRSVDFQSYFALLRQSYPDSADQALALATLQLHWDRTDPVSYYRHLSQEPFTAGQPRHVLLAPAKADYEVAVFTNEIAVRSGLGIALLENYDRTRMPFGLTPVRYPHRGSGLVLYDFGNPWPAPGNRPPTDTVGNPHGRPRQAVHHDRQLVTFLRTGEIVDVCGGDGCRPD